MIHKFNPESQKELIKSVMGIQLNKSKGMVSIAEAVKELKISLSEGEDAARRRELDNINQRRRSIFEHPGNEWSIYELCKHLYELAEIDRVDFHGGEWTDLYQLVAKLVPFESDTVIVRGVREYHDSCVKNYRRMRWMDQDQNQHSDSVNVVNQTLIATQHILYSFIRDKGLKAEFDAYFETHPLSHDGQAAH